MKPWYLGPLIFLALGSSAQVVEGQRLSEGFRTHDVGSLVTQAHPASQRTAHYQFPQVDVAEICMACGRGSVRRCS